MTTSAAPAPRALGSATLAAYAAPQLALAALYFPVFVYLAPVYANDRGVPLEQLGIVLILVRLVDAVTDPAMGALSDRLRTRFGRRKLWLALSVPLVCVSVWMAMRPPESVDIWYVAVWLTALTLSWTVALTPYQAWGGELATDYAGRARVTAWRESAFLIGTLAAAIIYAQAGGDAEGLGAIAVVVVVALPALAAIALAFAPEPPDRSRRDRPPARVADILALLARNAPFKRVLLAQFINSAANGLPAALFLFFAADVLGMPSDMAGLALALYFLTAVASTPLWAAAAKRMPKHRAWGLGMLATCAVFGSALLLGPGDWVWFAVICAITGVGFGADVVLPNAIQADVVDVDTAESGEQRTGLYFALWAVATKGASAIAVGLGLWTLGSVGSADSAALGAFAASLGYVASEARSAEEVATLALLYAGVPVALKLAAVAVMWRFPLDRAAQEALAARIAAAARR